MISPITSVKFGSSDFAQTLINKDGKFSKKPSQQIAPSNEKPEKEVSTKVQALGWIGVGLALAALWLGCSVEKGNLKKIETPEGIKDRFKNIGYSIGEKVKNGYDSLVKLFKKDSKKSKETK